MKVCLLFVLLAVLASANPILSWDTLEKRVRDQTIPKDSARVLFKQIYDSLISYSKQSDFSVSHQWIFPVQGYSINDVGKGGFKPDIPYGGSINVKYSFYDGNKHGGHPAYDIFILDNNRDSRDDKTRKPVSVLAPVDLLILSVSTRWNKGSDIRGGKYVWALDALAQRLFYFAHLDSVSSAPDTFIKAGTIIGTVGRTGKNAALQRSPTHLHLMVLELDGSDLKSYDFYKDLSGKK